MIKPIAAFCIIATLLFSCSNSNKKETEQTDSNVANAFIRALLDNRLDDAHELMLNDDENEQWFATYKRQHSNRPKTELDGLKAADILLDEISNVADTVSITNYRNS